MDRGMASSLPTEKLDRSNYASWSYKMHQYLLGHGYWSFVEGTNEVAPEPAHKDLLGNKEQAACFTASHLVCTIRCWRTFATSTRAQKFQLQKEINNIWQMDMMITDCTTKTKKIYDALGFINVTMDEDKMVQICLGGLAHRYEHIWMIICTREKLQSFFNLQSMLMVKENHASGSKTTQPNNRV